MRSHLHADEPSARDGRIHARTTATRAPWWAEHAKTFEFGKPDPSDGVDVATLTAWTDRRFGYRVKRPDGTGWTLKAGDASFRIQLQKLDAKFESGAFGGWSVHNSAGKKLRDLKSYTEWWINEQFPKELDHYAPGGDPTTEDRSFGGRDFTVVLATGVGRGSLASWGDDVARSATEERDRSDSRASRRRTPTRRWRVGEVPGEPHDSPADRSCRSEVPSRGSDPLQYPAAAFAAATSAIASLNTPKSRYQPTRKSTPSSVPPIST